MPMYIGMQVCMYVCASQWLVLDIFSTSFTTLYFMTGILLNLELVDSVMQGNW